MRNIFSKNAVSRFILPFFVLVILFGIYLLKNDIGLVGNIHYYNTGVDAQAENDVGQFTLTWVGGKAYQGIVDEDGVLQVEPGENNIYNAESNTSGGAQITYQLMFNMGGSAEAPAGAIKIKVPRYLFYDRDGKVAEQIIDIPLVEYPEEAGTGFNYYFETDENGEEYLVLQNYQTIPSTYSFECSLSWILKTPSVVADGYTKTFNGTVDIDMDLSGTVDITSTSNDLTLEYSSHATLNTASASYYSSLFYDSDMYAYYNVRRGWYSNWSSTIKPDNADDYVYVEWTGYTNVYYATQPYEVEVTAEPTDDLGGEVIAYARGYYYNTAFSSSYSPVTDSYVYKITTPSSTYDEYLSFYYPVHVLVKYPKDKLLDGETHTLSVKYNYELTGVDGASSVKTASTSRTYKYVKPETKTYTYGFTPAEFYSLYIYGGDSKYGAINKFEVEDVDSYSVPVHYNNYSTSYSYYSYATIRNFPMTLSVDGDATNPEDYGKREYTSTYLFDSMVLGKSDTGYEILNSGDYEITSFSLSSYTLYNYIDKTVTDGNIIYDGWQSDTDTDYANYPDLKVYYEKDGEWNYYGYVNYKNSYLYFYDLDGNSVRASNDISLPEGVTGIKYEVTSNKYSVYLYSYFDVELINSEHVLEMMEDKKELYLYGNIGAYTENADGEKSSYKNTYFSSNFRDIVYDKDQDKYGLDLNRTNSSSTYLTRLTGGSTGQNNWVNYVSDPANRRVKANYTAYAYETILYDKELLTAEDVLDSKVINEQRVGTFYSLLPIGMTVDLDTVVVQTFDTAYSSTSSGNNMSTTGTVVPSKVSLVENYKDTGRTMLIVSATIEDSDFRNYVSKYYSGTNYTLYTGFTLKYTGLYSWDCIYDYGNSLTNTVAYKSGSGKLSNGYADDASSLSSSFVDKSYFIDLDKDGNPEGSLKDTVYAQRTLSFAFNTASDTSFKIGVKTANLADYDDGKDGSVVASAGGYYSYRLRYVSQKNVLTSDLVLYDVLEDYDVAGTESWKGTLVNIDTTQAVSKGIKPTIYYSTVKGLNLYEYGKSSINMGTPKDGDLTNTAIWSTEKPEDASTITAVAIDLSKKEDGSDYVLQSEESVLVILNMQAPVDNAVYLEKENAKAMNVAWWGGTTSQLGVEHYNFSVYEWNEVLLTVPQVGVEKQSHIESGTEDDPTNVIQGDVITYDILVTNKSTYEMLSDVNVSDVLPDGVIPIVSDLAYYIEGEGSLENSTLMSKTEFVKYTQNGMNLSFTISQLLSGQVVHILIPVEVDPAYTGTSDTIKNIAQLNGFNGVLYESMTDATYHEISHGDLEITKTVKGFGDKQKEFKFKITLIAPVEETTDETTNEESSEESSEEEITEEETVIDPNVMLNHTYGNVTFVNGEATITLKDGETVVISGIPEGYKYIVTEEEYSEEGYSTIAEGTEGIVVANGVHKALFTNTYVLNVDTIDFISILVVVGISSFVIIQVFYKKKKYIDF